MAASPSSSPRLPSPPPIAEDQLGPKSPIAMPNEHGELARNPFEANALRRIRPGTKAADMALGPPLVPLTDIDSPFQLTEHLKSLHNAALHRDGSTTISPIDRETATRLAQPPDGVDKYLWLYELCRLLCKEINAMIVALFQDDPPCSAQTCNEMRASEWQYLCAVHDPPKPCCAIDYCCHTLDWTNHVLTSQKNFPSRMSLGADSGSGHQQLRQLTNIFRRVYRIFAHAWFQHREMYWKVELKSGLYVFFKTVCDVYNLIPEDNYTVPPEAEGIEPTPAPKQNQPSIIKRQDDNVSATREQTEGESQPIKLTPNTGSTTQRHRHTPSIGSESITTVLEDPEEDDDKTSKLEETVILSNEPPEEPVVTSTNKEVTTGESTNELSQEKHNEPSIPTTTTAELPITATEISITAAEVPTIAVEHTDEPEKSADPESSSQAEAEAGAEAEAEAEAETETEGEKAESLASDTDSHGSWQVLTNEVQSSEATPASSVAAPETETETIKGEEIAGKLDSLTRPTESETEPPLPVESGSEKELEDKSDVKILVPAEVVDAEESETPTKEPEKEEQENLLVKEPDDSSKEKIETKEEPSVETKDLEEVTKTAED